MLRQHHPCSFECQTHTHKPFPLPVLRTRSRRSGVLGAGLRVCRGDRVLGVEDGE